MSVIRRSRAGADQDDSAAAAAGAQFTCFTVLLVQKCKILTCFTSLKVRTLTPEELRARDWACITRGSCRFYASSSKSCSRKGCCGCSSPPRPLRWDSTCRRARVFSPTAASSMGRYTQFTCFTGTKVQILTLPHAGKPVDYLQRIHPNGWPCGAPRDRRQGLRHHYV